MSTIRKLIINFLYDLTEILDRGKVYGQVTITHQGVKFTVDSKFMAELREGQYFEVEIIPLTFNGNPASIEAGTGEWTSSDTGIAYVVEDPENELKARVYGRNGSDNGSVLIEFRADADLEEGVRDFVVSGTVTVTQGEVVTGTMNFGEAQDVPSEEVEDPDNTDGAEEETGNLEEDE